MVIQLYWVGAHADGWMEPSADLLTWGYSLEELWTPVIPPCVWKAYRLVADSGRLTVRRLYSPLMWGGRCLLPSGNLMSEHDIGPSSVVFSSLNGISETGAHVVQ